MGSAPGKTASAFRMKGAVGRLNIFPAFLLPVLTAEPEKTQPDTYTDLGKYIK